MRVIVNTSPFIALDRIRRLGLLQQLYGQVIRPQSVLDELLAGRADLRTAGFHVSKALLRQFHSP